MLSTGQPSPSPPRWLLPFSLLLCTPLGCAGPGASAKDSEVGYSSGPRAVSSNRARAAVSAGPSCVPSSILEQIETWPDLPHGVSQGHPLFGQGTNASLRIAPEHIEQYRNWGRGMTWAPEAPVVELIWETPEDWAFAFVLTKRPALAASGAQTFAWRALVLDRNGCELSTHDTALCTECHRAAPSDGLFGGTLVGPSAR
jgi:hypothetical protein